MKNDKNNKIIMWMLGICLAISLVFVGQESSHKSQLETKYEKLDAKYQKLKKDKTSVDQKLESLHSDYCSLKGSYDDIDYKYSILTTRFDDLNKKYRKLKPKTVKPKAVSAKIKSSNSSSNTSSDSSDDDSSTSAEVIVHITDYGSKYHAAGCKYLKKSDITISKSEAEQRGLSPCSVCNP